MPFKADYNNRDFWIENLATVDELSVRNHLDRVYNAIVVEVTPLVNESDRQPSIIRLWTFTYSLFVERIGTFYLHGLSAGSRL
jgi:hypothetical protein